MFLGLLLAVSLWSFVGEDSSKSEELTEEQYIEITLKKLGYPENAFAGVSYVSSENTVYVPIKDFFTRQSLNPFGAFETTKYNGYHCGVDVEVSPSDVDKDVPVYSIYNGTVLSVEMANGYGGVITIRHSLGEAALIGVYGHMRLSDIKVSRGDKVSPGELIGYLGASYSEETDWVRKHLHFGLNKTGRKSIVGYVDTKEELERDWINPTNFLRGVGAIEVRDSN